MEAYLASGGTLMLCSHSMYHVQRLCQKAIWVHHGRNHMQGTAESVTQAYLAYHEEKNQRAKSEERTHQVSGSYATFQELAVLAADNSVQSHFEMGDEIIVNGIYHSPDGFPTVLMVGVMRIDGTPVFGTFSPSRERYGNRIGPGRYAFRFVLLRNTLLPGKYKIKAHTLDEHGLRLFDSIEADIVIGGKSLDHGLVWLQHDWWPGEDIGAQGELNTSNK